MATYPSIRRSTALARAAQSMRASRAPLAALPISLLIGLGSVVGGKAAVETRGLTWVIVAHAMLDIGIMSAFFVPR